MTVHFSIMVIYSNNVDLNTYITINVKYCKRMLYFGKYTTERFKIELMYLEHLP